MVKCCLGCMSLFLLATLILAGGENNAFRPQPYDWPQWQGPERTTISQETGLLKSWPKDGPPLLWKATGLGEGFGTPSVAAGRIFSMGNRGKTEYVMALDARNGKQLWV